MTNKTADEYKAKGLEVLARHPPLREAVSKVNAGNKHGKEKLIESIGRVTCNTGLTEETKRAAVCQDIGHYLNGDDIMSRMGSLQPGWQAKKDCLPQLYAKLLEENLRLREHILKRIARRMVRNWRQRNSAAHISRTHSRPAFEAFVARERANNQARIREARLALVTRHRT